MASLFDPKLKLQWAKKHLDALAVEIAIFKESNKYRILVRDDQENEWYIIRFQLPHNDHVFKLALIAGDFIASLRSSLDHLAWQLALLSASIPSRHTCFPICEEDSPKTQRWITRCTHGISAGAISIMMSFQPYNSGEAFKATHLWRLNSLWNIDKHRHIAPHGVSTDWLFNLNFEQDTQIPMEELDDGGIMRIPIALKDKVIFNPTPGGVDVFFGDRSERLELSLKDLIEMYEFVATTVIPAFASFFPPEEYGGFGVIAM